MIRAVIDPGVLVSAFIGRQGSVADRIVRAWRRAGSSWWFPPALLAELTGVLARPKFARAARERRAEDFVDALRMAATLFADAPPGGPITRDPKDDYLIRLVRTAGADVLVSGDRDVLSAGVADVIVLPPRAFLDQLDTG